MPTDSRTQHSDSLESSPSWFSTSSQTITWPMIKRRAYGRVESFAYGTRREGHRTSLGNLMPETCRAAMCTLRRMKPSTWATSECSWRPRERNTSKLRMSSPKWSSLGRQGWKKRDFKSIQRRGSESYRRWGEELKRKSTKVSSARSGKEQLWQDQGTFYGKTWAKFQAANQIQGYVIDSTVQVLGMAVAQTTSPFIVEILRAILPQNFKIPYIELYEGRMDPLEHLRSYHVLMEFESVEDTIMCKAFPLTLRGAAMAWFTSLRPGTIGSFKQLEDAFAAQFLRFPFHLSSIVQREGSPERCSSKDL